MIYWALILLTIVAVFVVFGVFKGRHLKEKKLAQIRAAWGKPKNAYRNFKLVGAYLNTFGARDDASASDLDLDDVFCFIDRTNSKPGQQYLYKKLQSPEFSNNYLTTLEQRIARLSGRPGLRELAELRLADLSHDDAYYLPELFSKTHRSIFNPLISFYINLGAPLVLSLVVALIVAPNQLFFLLLLLFVIANVAIHISNKTRMLAYTHSLPQVLLLYKVAAWLFDNDLLTQSDELKQSLARVAKLKKSLGFINIQNKVAADPTDISYLFTEWLKMFLLTEPLNFIYSINRVNKYRDDIRLLFESVAGADMAISIQSVREGLPWYCVPEFSDENELIVTDLYHPLIENCVPNSIAIDNRRGVLITGSNMSGKTTFIRSLAINILLSQTIHTSFSARYKAPALKIFTSIDMSDDLSEQTSYFQAEASSIRNIIRNCAASGLVSNLVIIDEIFRGTNTIERIAAAKAVLSYFIENNIFILVSTHDLELAELLGNEYKVFSFEELVGDDRMLFDYKIKEGLLKNRNGIAVLKRLDYPQSIIDEALKISYQLRERYSF